MTTDLLTGHEYKSVEGIYRLGRLLEGSGERAIYETGYGHGGQAAWIELRRGDTPDAGRILARWREALELLSRRSHPNLMQLYAAGTSMLDGVPIIYLVMERADDSLAGVLAERALSEEETRQMLEPALSALSYLHNHGFVHRGLEPSNILAVEDILKLSTDSVERIDDGGGPENDMWTLGLVLVQALTRGVPKLATNPGPYVLQEAPEPLRGVVRHCLDADPEKRWTADQAIAYLLGQANPRRVTPMSSVPPQVSASEVVSPEVVSPEAVSPKAVSPKLPPLKVSPIRETLPQAGPARRQSNGNNRKWIYGPLAGLILIAGVVGLSRRANQGPPAGPAGEGTSAKMIAPPVATLPQTERGAAPRAGAPIEKRDAPKPAVTPRLVPSHDKRADGWAVVVAAYGAHDPAEKRAQAMGKKYSRFKVEVFEPASEKARHLVVLGTNLSEENAEALRKRAVAAGLPRDAYIKRFAADTHN